MNPLIFFFSNIRRHTICSRDWSSDVCSSDLVFSGSYIEASSCRHRERIPRSGDAETGPARRVGHAEKTLRERRNTSVARQVDSRAEQVGSETGIKSVHVVPAEVSDNPEPTLGIEGHGCSASVNVEIR